MCQVEIDVLRNIQFDIDTGISAIVCTHRRMCSVYLGQDTTCYSDGAPNRRLFDSTLQGLCRKLGMDTDRWPESFHVGGNDANYTLKSALLLAIEAYQDKQHLMSRDQLERMEKLEVIARARLSSLGAVRGDFPHATAAAITKEDDEQRDTGVRDNPVEETSTDLEVKPVSKPAAASISNPAKDGLGSSDKSNDAGPQIVMTKSAIVPTTVDEAETAAADVTVEKSGNKDCEKRSKKRKQLVGKRERIKMIWKRLIKR